MRLQGYHRVTADFHTPAAEDRDVTRSTLPCLRCRRDVPFPLKRAKHKPSTRRLAVLALHCATVGSSGSWGSATGAVDRCLSVPGACGSCRSKSSLKEVPPRYLTLTARDSYTSTVELHVVR